MKDDDYNILKTFTTGGSAQPSGSTFSFSLVNDALYQRILDQTATLTLYSPKGEFKDIDIPIRGVTMFETDKFWVYPTDEVSTSARLACATPIKIAGKDNWRVPNIVELGEIYDKFKDNLEYYGFAKTHYWTSIVIAGNCNFYVDFANGDDKNNARYDVLKRRRCIFSK